MIERQAHGDLTAVVAATRRGLRRDVAEFARALDSGELLVPLLRDVEGAQEGETIEVEGSLEIVPHLIRDEDGQHYAVLFTAAELMESVASELGWTTDGDELKGCTLPATVACQMALGVIDEQEVFGLVLNPGTDSELCLRRSELSSIVAGQPIPLVGYLEDLPPLEDERILVAEGTGLPAELAEEISGCLAKVPAVASHRLERTFNPERDLEPHPTLSIVLSDAGADRRAIARTVIERVGERLPAPGYLDIVFDDSSSDPG